MPPNRFESEVESFLEGPHGDRTHIKRADHPRLHHYAGRYSVDGPSCHQCPHVNPLIRAWAAPPTLQIAGSRAKERVNARNSRFACDQHTMPEAESAKTQTHSAKIGLFAAFHPMGLRFGGRTASSRGVTATNWGNCAMQGCDTPATRRRSASHGAKPPSPPVRKVL